MRRFDHCIVNSQVCDHPSCIFIETRNFDVRQICESKEALIKLLPVDDAADSEMNMSFSHV